eukprot:EG_transcript_22395
MGAFILRHKVPAVVVESAVTPTHGLATGSRVSCADYDPGPGGAFLQMLCGSAAQLGWEDDPLASVTWEHLAAHLNGELLAYVAAFHNAAELIYGDVPKEETFQQLHQMTTVLDLDEEFGARASSNYLDLLEGGRLVSQGVALDTDRAVPRILFLEREAALAEQLALAARRHVGRVVVGIVGAEHVFRVKTMLETGAYERILRRKAERVPLSPESAGPGGVRRALLAAVLAQVGESARVAMDAALGPVPEAHLADYRRTLEVYGSVRMLLAAVDRPLLDRLCCALE